MTDVLGLTDYGMKAGFQVPLRASHKPAASGERCGQGLKFARPMMCRGAGFDSDQAGRQLLQEGQHVATLNVRFGSRANDLRSPHHVRFTPDSDQIAASH
jgi:hypothetical protein